jgi:hypothetical protein
MGRFVLPGVANGAAKIWAVVALVVLAVGAWLGVRVLLATRTAGETILHRAYRLAGGPTGLMLLMAFGYLVYMLYVRSTTALNQLDLRLLNPAYIPLVVLGLTLIARLDALGPAPANRWPRRGLVVAAVWTVANIGAGMVAMVAFAAGNPYFEGNYETDTFVAVRDNPALDALPADCRVESNLPNALYPAVEATWSPRRTGLESDERVDDVQKLQPKLDDRPTCLVWIDEPPRYGHLYTLSQLRSYFDLQPLAKDGDVQVFRMEPLPAN